MQTTTSHIPISSIHVTTRYREDFGDLPALVASIVQNGLIQPIAVVESNGAYELLAGERRFRAATIAGLENIPVNIYPSSLSMLDRRVIELEENVRRKDMDWKEKANLEAAIHKIYAAKHAEDPSSFPRSIEREGAGGWSIEDTALRIGTSRSKVGDSIQLATFAAQVPAIAACETAADARNMLKRLTKKIEVDKAAERIESSRSNTPIEAQRKALCLQYVVKDFFEGVKDIPDNSIQFIEIDPPYGIDLKTKRKTVLRSGGNEAQTADTYNEIDIDNYMAFMFKVVTEAHRTLSPDGWMILWFGPDPWFTPISMLLKQHNFSFSCIPGIWSKGLGGSQTMAPKYLLPRSYEMFYYCRKGPAEIQMQGSVADVFNYPRAPVGHKIHPTERPIELIQDIISTFAKPNSRGMVPFAGSGNTLLAMANLGIPAIGWDLSKSYRDSYVVRVQESEPGKYHSYHKD